MHTHACREREERDLERVREGERVSIHLLTPQRLGQAKPGYPEPHLVFAPEWQHSKYVNHHLLPPYSGGSWIKN